MFDNDSPIESKVDCSCARPVATSEFRRIGVDMGEVRPVDLAFRLVQSRNYTQAPLLVLPGEVFRCY